MPVPHLKVLGWSLGAAAVLAVSAAAFVPSVRVASAPSKSVTHDANYVADGALLRHGDRYVPEIALTFDDGPHPESIGLILDTLRAYGVKATFFLVGRQIEEHPAWARRIIEAGHEVGNHTQNHRRLIGLSEPEFEEEVNACARAFHAATGHTMTLFRPPGMRYNRAILRRLQAMGYTTIGWTAAAKDFETVSHRIEGMTTDEIVDRVLKTVDNGGIILLHDTKQTAEALPRLISVLRVSGHRFVTVSQMLARLPNTHVSPPVRR